MLKYAFAVGSVLLVAGPAVADQCAWNSKSVADQAIKLMPKGTVLQEFCAPCKDTKATKIVVDSTSVKLASQTDPDSNVIVVNGKGELDLAYAYLQMGPAKEWTNVGMTLKCGDVSDVDLKLDPKMVAN